MRQLPPLDHNLDFRGLTVGNLESHVLLATSDLPQFFFMAILPKVQPADRGFQLNLDRPF